VKKGWKKRKRASVEEEEGGDEDWLQRVLVPVLC